MNALYETVTTKILFDEVYRPTFRDVLREKVLKAATDFGEWYRNLGTPTAQILDNRRIASDIENEINELHHLSSLGAFKTGERARAAAESGDLQTYLGFVEERKAYEHSLIF